MWPSPLRVTSTADSSCLASDFAHPYGVAGSPVEPTTTIGGAPAPDAGPGVRCAGTDQNAHVRSLYAAAWNRGATLRNVAASLV